MYNRTKQWWFESTYLGVGEGKVLLNIIVKPSMFGLRIVLMETVSHQFNLVYLKMV